MLPNSKWIVGKSQSSNYNTPEIDASQLYVTNQVSQNPFNDTDCQGDCLRTPDEADTAN